MPGTEFIVFAVFAAPMLGLLIASLLGVDQVAAKPQQCVVRRRVTPRVDEYGQTICQDPDGRCFKRTGR